MSKNSDDLNIESPAFDQGKAFLNYLKNNSVPSIIQRSNELHVGK